MLRILITPPKLLGLCVELFEDRISGLESFSVAFKELLCGLIAAKSGKANDDEVTVLLSQLTDHCPYVHLFDPLRGS